VRTAKTSRDLAQKESNRGKSFGEQKQKEGVVGLREFPREPGEVLIECIGQSQPPGASQRRDGKENSLTLELGKVKLRENLTRGVHQTSEGRDYAGRKGEHKECSREDGGFGVLGGARRSLQEKDNPRTSSSVAKTREIAKLEPRDGNHCEMVRGETNRRVFRAGVEQGKSSQREGAEGRSGAKNPSKMIIGKRGSRELRVILKEECRT